MLEEARRKFRGRQFGRSDARCQRQDRQGLVDLVHVHVPAGQPVLRWRQAGHQGGDSAGGGRRENGCHAAEQVAMQVWAGGVPGQRAQAETVDDQQHDVTRAGKLRGRQRGQLGVKNARAAASRRDALHQIDNAAASVIGKHSGTHGWAFYAKRRTLMSGCPATGARHPLPLAS